jgi:iron-sulfur cluster repair protein YtfE (RIC family)
MQPFRKNQGLAAMNLDRFREDHDAIMVAVTQLRSLVRSGVAAHAAEIARAIVSMSAKIKLHLSAEDASLYPYLARSNNARAIEMGSKLQADMGHLAKVYMAFAQQWNIEQAIAAEPERFLSEATEVFTALATRIKLENRELYPMAESV